MRRKDRELKLREEHIEILDECKVCRLAMTDCGSPYIVPMNFGYEFSGDMLVLYFHSASQGRKMDILKESPNVCFEMDCFHSLTEGETACQYGYKYSSIVGFGTAQFISDINEKKAALSVIMKHQTGKDDFSYEQSELENVAVFKVVSADFGGKRCK